MARTVTTIIDSLARADKAERAKKKGAPQGAFCLSAVRDQRPTTRAISSTLLE